LRQLLKFLHTMGAIGLLGAISCLLVLLNVAPSPRSLAAYASTRGAMDSIAAWIFLPSLGVTLIAGLVAIAYSRAYHNAGWAWAKALSGVLLFESGFVGVVGPMRQEAERSAAALAGQVDPATLAASLTAERNTLWILLAVSVFNVAFGIWRPRLTRLRD
jgi:hypothetical protein